MSMSPITRLTHIVLKVDDIQSYLNIKEQQDMGTIMEKIKGGRQAKGLKGENEYLIVNTDEPYAEEVYKIILKGEANKNKKE